MSEPETRAKDAPPDEPDVDHPLYRAGFAAGEKSGEENAQSDWDVIKSAAMIRSRLIDSCAYALSELGAFDTSEVGDKVRAALGRLADRIEEDAD